MSTSNPLSTFATHSMQQPQKDPVGKNRDKLKRMMRGEIFNQTWQFPPEVVARMLSPKTLSSAWTPSVPDEAPGLDDYSCEVSSVLSRAEASLDTHCNSASLKNIQWPNTSQEPPFYEPLAKFLNACVAACKGIIQEQSPHALEDLFHRDLAFIVFDRPTKDSIDGAPAVKPDLAGGNGYCAGDDLWWSPPAAEKEHQMNLPTEVKWELVDLIRQCCTYGRALFSACPSRAFALVLAFCHKTAELRFLIFHRGGLTASTPCSVKDAAGRKGIVQMLLSVLLWKEPRDRGFPPFCNEQAYAIPQSPDSPASSMVHVRQVLYFANCVRGRATRVCSLGIPAPDGDDLERRMLPLSQAGGGVRRSTRLTTQASTEKASQKPGYRSNKKLPSKQNSEAGQTSSALGAVPEGAVQETVPKDEVPGARPEETGTTVPFKLVPRCVSFAGSVGHQVSSTARWSYTSNVPRKDIICKTSWQEEGRKWNEADMLKATSDCFGTAQHICSFVVSFGENEPVSNSIYLPPRGKPLAEYFWDIFDRRIPAKVDRRYFMATLTGVEGDSLTNARSSLELCDAIVHATLGWLGTFLRGYLQRNISTGNVLRVPTPREMPPFELPRMDNEESLDAELARLSLADTVESSEAYAKKIMDAVEALKVTTKGKGFMTDGDLCANMSTYFTQTHSSQAISGTAEFMSAPALDAIRDQSDYLQTPVDDIASLYWVGQWSVLFNEHSQGDSTKEKSMRSDAISYRAKVPQDIQSLNDRQTQLLSTSTICQDWVPILSDWYQSVAKLESIWARTYDSLVMSRHGRNEDILRPLFNRFALRGVAEMLEVMTSHRPRLESSQRFKPSFECES
ncbi:hypothetical protein BXZ70DRAFT_1011659 [Cristinia sonorae]|uniref:Fungal-type protein kinase domain-containing protein n=1 Tax=Cristinia sonorae TaxID=1940300 RepID=A0A8K0XL84_9AGAR|nr:hypothetical protein BXZ70DRAFT_1011659 [Cristinia sonorae]